MRENILVDLVYFNDHEKKVKTAHIAIMLKI